MLQNKNTIGNLYLWTLKKNALIITLATVLSLMARPGFLVIGIINKTSVIYLNSAPRPEESVRYIISSDALIGGYVFSALIAVTLILLLFSINFRYLHKKNQSDLYHALPLKRNELLLTRFGATLTGVMIPIVLSGIGEAIMAGITGTEELTVVGSPHMTFMTLVMILAASAMTLLVCVLVGSTFDLLLSLLVVNVGWMSVYLIAGELFSTYLLGYVSGSDDGLFLLAPFAQLLLLFIKEDACSLNRLADVIALSGWFCLYWLIFAAVMVGLALLLGKKRPNEAAGKPYAYGVIPVLFQAVVAILAGYLLGIVFSNYTTLSPIFYIFFILGAFLGSVIFGAIVSRGFKTVVRSLITAGVSTVLFVVVILCARFDVFGYESLVPDASSVKSVQIDVHMNTLNSFENYDCLVEEAENIETVVAIHEEILAHPTILLDEDSFEADSTRSWGTVTLHYRTKSGSTVTRSYELSTFKPIFSYIADLIRSDEYQRKQDPLYQYEQWGGNVETCENFEIKIDAVHDNYGKVFSSKTYPTLFKEISEAYRKDLETYGAGLTEHNEKYAIFIEDQDRNLSVTLTVTYGHENTLKLLDTPDMLEVYDSLQEFRDKGGSLDECAGIKVIVYGDTFTSKSQMDTEKVERFKSELLWAYDQDMADGKLGAMSAVPLYDVEFYDENDVLLFALSLTKDHKKAQQIMDDFGFGYYPQTTSQPSEYDAIDQAYRDGDYSLCTKVRVVGADHLKSVLSEEDPELATELQYAYQKDMEIIGQAFSYLRVCNLQFYIEGRQMDDYTITSEHECVLEILERLGYVYDADANKLIYTLDDPSEDMISSQPTPAW